MGLEGGQILDGKYRIVRVIGAGGMGVVYEGENLLIRRRVAIKVMVADPAANMSDAIRRFEREAQAAGQIGSDHILEVLDLGTLPDGARFMVMEYLDGETLAERINRNIHLTPRQIAPIARQFLAALASAHAAGIIHRDLKPENIFILRTKAGRSDFVKLIDFGVSKFSNSTDRTTRAGSMLGTPCYMSPEQARGRGETDVRSDIYACGVILFEAVTGKLPFDGETFNDLMFKIALSETPSALTFMPSLDPEFAWLIERAMARDPAARFQTVQEFSEKLDDWMRKNELTGTLAQPLPPEAFPMRQPMASRDQALTIQESLDGDIEALQLQATGVDESWARSQQAKTSPVRRRGVALIGLAALCAVAVVVVSTLALRSGGAVSDQGKPLASLAPPPSVMPSETPGAPATVASAIPSTAPSTSAIAAASSSAPLRPSFLPGPLVKPKPGTKPAGKPLDFGY